MTDHAEGALQPDELSDAELIMQLRAGDEFAFERLFRRHAPAVRRYARRCCRDEHAAEDLTAEVFARTLHAVRGGAGPESAVRAYLLTSVRRVAATWAKSGRRMELVEDFADFAVQAVNPTAQEGVVGPGADVQAMRRAEQSLVMQAFRSLPERWQAVLWQTSVEDESAQDIAPLFGLTPNAVSVLARRAREGLRAAYLQAHVSAELTRNEDCARFVSRLGDHARGNLRTRAQRDLHQHLDTCAACRAAALDLADINSTLRAVLPVAVIGWIPSTVVLPGTVVPPGIGGPADRPAASTPECVTRETTPRSGSRTGLGAWARRWRSRG